MSDRKMKKEGDKKMRGQKNEQARCREVSRRAAEAEEEPIYRLSPGAWGEVGRNESARFRRCGGRIVEPLSPTVLVP